MKGFGRSVENRFKNEREGGVEDGLSDGLLLLLLVLLLLMWSGKNQEEVEGGWKFDSLRLALNLFEGVGRNRL